MKDRTVDDANRKACTKDALIEISAKGTSIAKAAADRNLSHTTLRRYYTPFSKAMEKVSHSTNTMVLQSFY
jgi:hypothetical protein